MRPIPASAAVRIDSSRPADFPLSKERIAVYNSGLVPIERYRRDAGYLRATAPESLRIDLGWGAEWMPWTREVVQTDAEGGLSFDFSETDEVARVLTDAGVRPYWSYCYVPKAARPDGGDWRTMAPDDTTWVRTVQAYVAGMRDRGVSVGYHEIYNEPDLRDERTGDATFYTGGLQDYLELYRETSTAIRQVDPTARIGGPALAVTAVHADWLDAFCRLVVDERLPLDFLSFHHYGHFGVQGTLQIVRETLARYPDLRHVEWHLNEYNAFSIDYPRGGLQDSFQLASTFAAELPRLLACRRLTRTHWAQYLDSGQGNFSGMVDIDGVPKPVHEVYAFYQRMPIDRITCQVDGPPGVGALASADASGIAAILWNRHFADVEIDLEVAGAQQAVIVMIDGDGVSRPTARPLAHGRAKVRLASGAVALLTSGDIAGRPTARRCWGIPVAGAAGWSDLDEATCTFRFGTNGDGWVSHGADLLGEAVPSEWSVSARGKDGGPVPASVEVRLQDGSRYQARTLTGTAAPHTLDLPSPPAPRDSTRLFMSVSAPSGALVNVAPVPGGAR